MSRSEQENSENPENPVVSGWNPDEERVSLDDPFAAGGVPVGQTEGVAGPPQTVADSLRGTEKVSSAADQPGIFTPPVRQHMNPSNMAGPPVMGHAAHHQAGNAASPGVPPVFDPSSSRPRAGAQAAPAPSSGAVAPGTNVPVAAMVLTGLVSGLVAALVASAVWVGLDRPETTLAPSVELAEPGSNRTIVGEDVDLQTLLAKAQPSVVSIQTGNSTAVGIFGGVGSGVLMTDDGLVLTNAHVIQGADAISVRFFDGQEREADIIGSLPDEDIALIQVRDVAGWIPAEIGSSGDLRVGDDVVAIGNALNLGGEPTVTTGIVSATNREIADGNIALDDLIQTDAAINPGNSGGPLLNSRGQVVGVNTAIIDGSQNIGFAIAIDSVVPLIDRITGGQVSARGAFLGVRTTSVTDLSEAARERFGVEIDEGAVVDSVTEGSPAELAGIEVGDVIVAVDDAEIVERQDLTSLMLDLEPESEVGVFIVRNNTRQRLMVELGNR